MKFYFCEKCGKRDTDVDLESGKARDKQLKGFFCADCAVGVMTVEMKPLTIAQAQNILQNTDSSAEPKEPKKVTTSAQRVNPGASTAKPKTPGEAIGAGTMLKFALAAGVAASLLVIFLLTRSPQAPQISNKSGEPAVVVPRPSANPVHERPVTRSVEKEPEAQRPEAAVKPDPAAAEFENVLTFVGSAENSADARIQRIEQFLKEFGDSIAAARARVLLNDLRAGSATKNPVVAEVPAIPATPATPATPTTPVVTPAAAPANNAVKATPELLRTLVPQLRDGKFTEARRTAENALAGAAAELQPYLACIATMEAAEQQFAQSLLKNAGQDVRLTTPKGLVAGKLLSVEGGVAKLEQRFTIDGQVKGGTTVSVAIKDLTAASREEFHKALEPTTAEAWMARAFEYACAEDFGEATKAAGNLKDPAISEPLKTYLTVVSAEQLEKQANENWRSISERAAKSLNSAQAKLLRQEVEQWQAKFDNTAFAKDPGMAAKAKLTAELERIELNVDARIAKLFKGRITAFDPRKQVITVTYDFADKEQTEDFEGTIWGTHAEWRKGGIFIRTPSRLSTSLMLPQYMAGDVSVQLQYKDLKAPYGVTQLGVTFFPGFGEAPELIYFCAEKPDNFMFRKTYRSAGVIYQTPAFKGADATEVVPPAGMLEASCHGKRYSAKLGGKVIIDYEHKNENTLEGISIGGGSNTSYLITGLQVTGRLSPRWLEKALKKK